MMLKRYKNKIIIILILTSWAFISCAPSQYRSYKQMVKRRTTHYGYKSNYQKKLRKNTMPVNRNYIIRNKQSAPPAWR